MLGRTQSLLLAARITAASRLPVLLGLSVLGAAAGGCGEAVGEPPADTPAAATPASENAVAEPAAAEAAVTLSQATWDEILQAVKSPGRPAVLDVWSLSCEPCLKEFPGLVRLDQQWGERLHCVSANIDFDGRRTRPPESYEPKVSEFLEQQKAELRNFLCTTPSDQVYEKLKIPSIPAVLVFDAQGKEVARFVDAGETLGFTYQKDVIPFVEKMLASDAAPAAEQ